MTKIFLTYLNDYILYNGKHFDDYKQGLAVLENKNFDFLHNISFENNIIQQIINTDNQKIDKFYQHLENNEINL